MRMLYFRSRRTWAIALATTLLTGTALATVAAPAQAASRTGATHHASARSAYPGSRVTVSGRVSPAATPRTVYLQQYYSKKWHRIATTRTTRGGYQLTLPTRSLGKLTFRLAVAAGAGGAKATTGSFTLSVVKNPGGNPRSYSFMSTEGDPSAPIARWNPCQSIGYRVNLAGSPAGALADIQGSIARLSSASGLHFEYRGGTTILPGRGDDTYPAGTQLVIAWAQPGQSSHLPAAPKGYRAAAGIGGPQWSDSVDANGRPASMITEGLVVLNASYSLAGGFGAGPKIGWQGTRGQLLMHELGHAVGLTHPKIRDNVQIMVSGMSRKPAVYGAGDRNGLRLVGRSGGCLSPKRPLVGDAGQTVRFGSPAIGSGTTVVTD